MSDGDEMAHHSLRRGAIVDHDRIRLDARQFAIHADERHPPRGHIPDGLVIAASRREDEPIDAFLRKHVEVHPLSFATLPGVAENEIVAAGVAMDDVFDAEHEIGEKGIGDVGNHHADGAGLAASKAARNAMRAIVERPYRDLDPTLGFRRYETGAVEHM